MCECHYFAAMQVSPFCKHYIHSFAQKFGNLDIAQVNMSDYARRYLQHLQQHHLYYLAIYASVLDEAMRQTDMHAGDIRLVDYGAGNGLLGIFARYCGFNTVVICDQDKDFIRASRMLALALQVYPDEFVSGDITDLLSRGYKNKIDAIVGTDVIEHIYNLDDFLGSVQELNPAMVTVFTTASNPYNYFKLKQLEKIQLKDELEGSDPGDFLLAGAEKHISFFEMRRQIIEEQLPGARAEELDKLATATRGLNEYDIIKCVTRYQQTGDLPVPPARQSNTCNPKTGSWTERVLSIREYRTVYNRYGFNLQTEPGFYNSYTAGIKKYPNLFKNILVKLTGSVTAPFITLSARKSR